MPDVGADVESICRKCGDVWHVVVAKVGDKIAKVQCKQCSGLHRHRPPDGPALKTTTTARSTTRTKTTSSKTRVKGVPSSNKPLVEPNMKDAPQPYKISSVFRVGDRIVHPKFGDGVVELIPGPQKIQVFFAQGRKVLAHGHNEL